MQPWCGSGLQRPARRPGGSTQRLDASGWTVAATVAPSAWCCIPPALVADAPAANGSVWEGTPWYPRFLYETKQRPVSWRRGCPFCWKRAGYPIVFDIIKAIYGYVRDASSSALVPWAGTLSIHAQSSLHALPPLALTSRTGSLPWQRLLWSRRGHGWSWRSDRVVLAWQALVAGVSWQRQSCARAVGITRSHAPQRH